jgi:transcriptional regulator with XRE-family HTH domain
MLVPIPLTLDQIARDRIRAWMAATHTTQSTLAARIGRDQLWMSQYLSAKTDADLETLRKMAEAFGRQFPDLFAQPSHPRFAKFFDDYLALPPLMQADLEAMAAHLRAALTPSARRRRRGSPR